MRVPHRLLGVPLLGPALLRWERGRLADSYFAPARKRIRAWLGGSRERTNFTYHLKPANLKTLASMLAVATGQNCETIRGYIDELNSDAELKALVRRLTEADPRMQREADPEARFGRRAGWYAVARATRPKVIVETGVDKGLGALALTAALRRNAAEGHPGRYYGTDINPAAGYLLSPPYTEHGEILYGDSRLSLRNFAQTIDLFINDSDHAAGYEREEYEIVKDKLAPGAILLGDNSHVTDELLEFAQRTGRKFIYFHEQPLDHWYPGGGIGIAYR